MNELYWFCNAGQTVVQAEFVRHPYQSKAHAKYIEKYEAREKQVKGFIESGH